MFNNKKMALILISTSLLIFSNITLADWFLSSETKALITNADAGDKDAQFNVGTAYDFGNGAPHDGDKAIKYYRMAADQGLAEAQNSLGSIYQAEKNYVEAKSWYERAAAQNHPTATNSLGLLYDLGLGVPQDRNKGFEFYSRAADLGHARAMLNIANMYGAGQLGKVDLFSTCVWSVRAKKYANIQDPELIQYLERVLPAIQKDLSGKDWGKCYEEANAWTPKLVKQ
jgi:TPR repeat protein